MSEINVEGTFVETGGEVWRNHCEPRWHGPKSEFHIYVFPKGVGSFVSRFEG